MPHNHAAVFRGCSAHPRKHGEWPTSHSDVETRRVSPEKGFSQGTSVSTNAGGETWRIGLDVAANTRVIRGLRICFIGSSLRDAKLLRMLQLQLVRLPIIYEQRDWRYASTL